MILQSGREIPDDAYESILDEIISCIIIQYASSSFEDFSDSVDLIIQSLQEDEGWLPDNNVFNYEEAVELVSKARPPAHEFANGIRQAYGKLCEKYIGTKSWELYK